MGTVRRIESDKEDGEQAGGNLERVANQLLEPALGGTREEHHHPHHDGSGADAMAPWATKVVLDVL